MVDGGLKLLHAAELVMLVVAFAGPLGEPSTTLPPPGQTFRRTFGTGAAGRAARLAGALVRLHPAGRFISTLSDLLSLYNAHKEHSGYALKYSIGCCYSGGFGWCGPECISTSQSGNGPCVPSGSCFPPVYNPAPTRVCGFKERTTPTPATNNNRSVWMFEKYGNPTEFVPSPSPFPTFHPEPLRRPPYDPTDLPDPVRPPLQPKPDPKPPLPPPPTPWPDDPTVPGIKPEPEPYVRPTPNPDPYPPLRPDPDPYTPPDWYPDDEPRPEPYGDPDTHPDPGPGVDPDPYRPPLPHWPMPWPLHPVVPLPRPRPRYPRPLVRDPQPDPDTPVDRPDPRPLPRPGVVSPELWDFRNPAGYRPSPPTRGTKERKVIKSSRLGRFEKPFSNVTEFMDFVGCLHDALPKGAQAKHRRYKAENGEWKVARISFKRKLAAVYENMGQLDPAKALACHMVNQAKDAATADISRRASKYFGRATGRSIGVGVGPAL